MLAVVLVVAVTVLLINGVNLMDGLDMLAGGVAAVAALAFAVLLRGPGRQLAVALAAALAGFLVFNRPPARVYLGDGGSYLLGTALAVLLARPGPRTSPSTVGVGGTRPGGRARRRAGLRRGPPAAGPDRPCWPATAGHPYDRLVAAAGPGPRRAWPTSGSRRVLGLGAVLVAATPRLACDRCRRRRRARRLVLVALAAATGALSPDQEAAA